MVIVQTSRFGPVEVDETRMIEFPRGILGFPQHKQYVLIQPEVDSTFYWLQAVTAADLAFVVTDPLLFVPDYQVPLREETRAELVACGPLRGQHSGDRQQSRRHAHREPAGTAGDSCDNPRRRADRDQREEVSDAAPDPAVAASGQGAGAPRRRQRNRHRPAT